MAHQASLSQNSETTFLHGHLVPVSGWCVLIIYLYTTFFLTWFSDALPLADLNRLFSPGFIPSRIVCCNMNCSHMSLWNMNKNHETLLRFYFMGREAKYVLLLGRRFRLGEFRPRILTSRRSSRALKLWIFSPVLSSWHCSRIYMSTNTDIRSSISVPSVQ